MEFSSATSQRVKDAITDKLSPLVRAYTDLKIRVDGHVDNLAKFRASGDLNVIPSGLRFKIGISDIHTDKGKRDSTAKIKLLREDLMQIKINELNDELVKATASITDGGMAKMIATEFFSEDILKIMGVSMDNSTEKAEVEVRADVFKKEVQAVIQTTFQEMHFVELQKQKEVKDKKKKQRIRQQQRKAKRIDSRNAGRAQSQHSDTASVASEHSSQQHQNQVDL